MERKDKSTAPSSQAAPSTAPAEPNWPFIKAKDDLEYNILEEDQIHLLEGLMTAKECKEWTRFIDALPLELTPPKKRGEAERVNYRVSYTSPAFASTLFALLSPHLPEFPHPTPGRPARRAVALNTNIRLYKYSPGQFFGPHYDDSVRDAVTGLRSEWTLLVYLSGIEDGVRGGETVFHREKGAGKIVPPLQRGMALLHRHGRECLLHEGSPVLEGVKYVLRSDLMFDD